MCLVSLLSKEFIYKCKELFACWANCCFKTALFSKWCVLFIGAMCLILSFSTSVCICQWTTVLFGCIWLCWHRCILAIVVSCLIAYSAMKYTELLVVVIDMVFHGRMKVGMCGFLLCWCPAGNELCEWTTCTVQNWPSVSYHNRLTVDEWLLLLLTDAYIKWFCHICRLPRHVLCLYLWQIV